MKLYTINEIAELMKVNRNTVSRWIKNGQLKAIKINEKNVRISEKQFNDFLEKGGASLNG